MTIFSGEASMKKQKAKARKPAKVKAKTKSKKKAAPSRSKKKSAAKVKTKAKKSPANVETTPRPSIIAPVNGVLLGFVEDYFAKIGVIALTLKSALSVGQHIQVLGHTTNFEETVDSMQIDHMAVTDARPADGVGIKVIGRARRGDHVYRLP
jgi:putative protease